jgi:uncharacterized repeat protein (TIGR01451 family)
MRPLWCWLWLIGNLAAAAAQAQPFVASAASLCNSLPEATLTNYISNSSFTDTAAPLGSTVNVDPPNSQPFNNGIANVGGLQTGNQFNPPLYQNPFPGDPARSVPASNRWLLANGNTFVNTAGIWWSQQVGGLAAGQTYTFMVYVSSPVNGAQNVPLPSLQVDISQPATTTRSLGVVPNDTAASDTWTLRQVAFQATGTTATLALRNVALTGAAAEPSGLFALAQPTLRRCASVANLAVSKTNGTTTFVPGATTSYVVTVSNGGPAAADGSTLRDVPSTGLACTSVSCTGTAGGAACPASGAGPGQLSPANLLPPGAGVVITSLPANSSVSFQVDCVYTATGS